MRIGPNQEEKHRAIAFTIPAITMAMRFTVTTRVSDAAGHVDQGRGNGNHDGHAVHNDDAAVSPNAEDMSGRASNRIKGSFHV